MKDQPLFALDFDPAEFKLGASCLLVGTDSYLADIVLGRLKQKLRKIEDIEVRVIYGDDAKSNMLCDLLDEYSIFSSAKLVIIRNAERLDKSELETLAAYFDAPSEIQSLAIVAEKTDNRLAGWKKISANCLQINCEPPRYGGLIRAWLESSLKKKYKTMQANAIEEFISRIELDYYYADNELTKLELLTKNSPTITVADVMKSLGTTRLGTLNEFYTALGKKQTTQVLEAMQKMLFADWEPLQIMYHITRVFTNIWKINLLRRSHHTDLEISSKHLNDLYPNQRKIFMDCSRSYTMDSLEKIMSILLETDSQFKLSTADSQVLLVNCLLRIMQS